MLFLTAILFNAGSQDIRNDLKKLAPAYKPMLFWHINGELTTEGIRKQMKGAKKLADFSGIRVLPLAPRKNRATFID